MSEDQESGAELSRRQFLRRTAVAGAVVTVGLGASLPVAAAAAVPQDTPSTFFSTVSIEESGTYAAPGSDGDLWANCWADDDSTYAANGDGRGFSDQPFKDIVMNRIDGTPESGLSGVKLAEADQIGTVWGDPTQYNRKPTGMVCVDGVLYVAVQDLKSGANAFDDVPNASISRSDDHGRTWQKTSQPMFTDHRFTTIFFLDFGKDSRNAGYALGPLDAGFVYAYGLDWNWRDSNTNTVPDPVDVYLARVPRHAVQQRSQWEFFTGTRNHRPTWSRKIQDKVAVLHDPTRRFTQPLPGKSGDLTVISQGGVLYNRPLDRYIYTSWTDPTFEFYESPTPWGPWKRFLSHDFGLVEWYEMGDRTHTPKNGGYATTIPSKYVSHDGQLMWVQSNWWKAPVPTPEANYNFNLRRLRVTPYRPTIPVNHPNSHDNLARSGADVTPIQVSAHYAHSSYYNDGDRTRSEDSYDGAVKSLDFWGYAFSRSYRMNRLVYTTGTMFPDGGWFASGPRVQVRQNFDWVDVRHLRITPDYPHSSSAGANVPYTISFETTWGDGVRVVGQPGGASTFTSIAELEVYLDN
ncbi:DUF4185 domain-containing protein [Fodinicola feengrottensis]|uniref:DUF4185 domain-containing protein n=1 Tax=Fodinicola feengrottensis TaxID=435914 RepID=A0ABN2H9S9_9ACTN|nr:DUF4185 domain-containing protein [Fodinicola feengrottensis]